jgi:predicted phage terminase large subunit-like protein
MTASVVKKICATKRLSLLDESPLALRARQLQIKRELWRRMCRKSLIAWSTEAVAPLVPGSHHRLILEEIEAVIRGENDRLMIFAPPGCGKSIYTSKISPAWAFAANPGMNILGASHTSTLAEEFSGDVQRYIRQHSATLGYDLRTERRDLWHTTNGGQYLAAGVNVGIAGFRADLAIIDDPVKSRQDADSEVYRERTWKWFWADLGPRLKPDGRIILMHTRWHEDDLAGRLLQTQQHKWRVLKLPALASAEDDPLGREIGEPLWLDGDYGYGRELFGKRDDFEQTGGMREWASLYQQEPRPTEGALFKVGNITVVDAPPTCTSVRAWDLAATAKTGTRDPDWTVGLKLGRLQDGRCIVLDVRRIRGDPADVEQAIVGVASQDGKQVTIGLPQDPGQAGKAQARYLVGKLAGYDVRVSPETGDKATRAAPAAAQCNIGNLLMVRAEWNERFLDELSAFPSGSKDDQVDALSRAFGMLVQTQMTFVAPIVVTTERQTWGSMPTNPS